VPTQHARAGELRGLVDASGDAEVDEDQSLLGLSCPHEHDVVGLHVAVEDGARVHVSKRAAHLRRESNAALPFEPAVLAEEVIELDALEVFEREEQPAIVFAAIDRPDDMGVFERQGEGDFLAKPGEVDAVAGTALEAQPLDGDGLTGLAVEGPVHLAHAITPEEGFELIAVGDDGERRRGRHSMPQTSTGQAPG
jgi:hypothetical protein